MNSLTSHLNQTVLTLDGNHHLNKFVKNTDPNDISLFRGRAYIPEDSQYQAYLADKADKGPEVRQINLCPINNTELSFIRCMLRKCRVIIWVSYASSRRIDGNFAIAIEQGWVNVSATMCLSSPASISNMASGTFA